MLKARSFLLSTSIQTVKKYTHRLSLLFLLLAFHLPLYFIPNNKALFVYVLVSIVGFSYYFKSLTTSLYVIFLLMLPFTKGKSLLFEIISSDNIFAKKPYNIWIDITISDFVLIILLIKILIDKMRTGWKSRSISLRRQKLYILFFFIFCFVSVFFSQGPIVSFLSVLKITLLLFAYIITLQLVSKTTIQNALFGVIASSVIFQGAWSILEFLQKGPLGRSIESRGELLSRLGWVARAHEEAGFIRSKGTFDHANTLGSFLATTLPFIFFQTFNPYRSLSERKIALWTSFLGLIGLILSASRASWGIVIIVICYGYWVLRKNSVIQIPQEIKKQFLVLILAVMAMFSFFIITRLSQISATLFPYTANTYTETQEFGGIYYRWYLIEKALLIASYNPLGIGVGMFPVILFQNLGGFASLPTQPHNVFIEILVDTGIVSLTAFIAFLASEYNYFLRTQSARLNNLARTTKFYAFLSSISFLGIASFYPFFTESHIFGYLWIFLGIMGG